jgi:hypothetical protein
MMIPTFYHEYAISEFGMLVFLETGSGNLGSLTQFHNRFWGDEVGAVVFCQDVPASARRLCLSRLSFRQPDS